jgi:predicted outer membrane protein
MLKALRVPVLFLATACSVIAQERTPPAATQPRPNPEASNPDRRPENAAPGRDPARPAATSPAREAGREGRNAADAREGSRDRLEAHLANCLILANQEEVALARFALEKSQDQRVKGFAQMLIDDHSKAIQELKKFAGDASIELEAAAPVTSGRETLRADSTTSPGTAPRESDRPEGAPENESRRGARPDLTQGRGMGMGSELLMIARDAHQECLRLQKEELGKKSGVEFDKGFVGSQIGAHLGMQAMLTATERHTSGEFQALLQKAQQTTMQHKQHAEQLMAQIKDVEGPRSGQAPGASRPGSAPATPAQPRTNPPADAPPARSEARPQ